MKIVLRHLPAIFSAFLAIGHNLVAGGAGHPVVSGNITLEGEIAGILTKPAGVDGKVPAVLMLHGFASHKDEVGGMFKREARALAENGIASLRIDFPGWGESGGNMWDSSLTVRVGAAKTAYRYLSALDFVDASRIGVLGFSMGGSTARIAAAEQPGWFKSMVAWSSASNRYRSTLSEEQRDTLEREGKLTVDLGWREVTLGKRFYEDNEAYGGRFLELISKYPGPFLAIVGSDDPAGADVLAFVDQAGGARREGVIIGCEGHIFEVLSEDQSKAERVLAKTLRWFLDTL